MLLIFQRFLLFSFFIIYLITSDAQSINDPLNNDDRNLVTTLANYRHRFERSMNLKKLRWAFDSLNSTAICDACDLLVPEVILSFSEA